MEFDTVPFVTWKPGSWLFTNTGYTLQMDRKESMEQTLICYMISDEEIAFFKNGKLQFVLFVRQG